MSHTGYNHVSISSSFINIIGTGHEKANRPTKNPYPLTYPTRSHKGQKNRTEITNCLCLTIKQKNRACISRICDYIFIDLKNIVINLVNNYSVKISNPLQV